MTESDKFNKTLAVCDCEHSMRLDADALAHALGLDAPPIIHTQLCRAQIDAFRDALDGGRPVVAACTQEAPFFEETREAQPDAPEAQYVNIRERAGWSDEGGKAGPKIAALLAEAMLDIPPIPSVTMTSDGVCLVYGRDETAIDAARQLADRLEVTVLLTRPDAVVPPRVMDVPVFKGTVTATRGHLGAFEVIVDDYAPMQVSARGPLAFDVGRAGASSRCDLILDLTGGMPLLPAPEKRDGYFNPDPGDPAAVQKAIFELADMVGEFEKPRYVDFDAAKCAHARSRVTGCTRCLDVCPASAITPGEESVVIDPHVCGGCGSCASVCPTGAATYAMPAGNMLYERLRTLLSTYRTAGGADPVLLVHDTRHGDDLIALMARFGRGLPARVLPFAVNEATQVGFDFFATAFAYGAGRVVLLSPPSRRDELDGLAGQIGVAEALMDGLGYGGGRVAVVTDADPDVVERLLYDLPPSEPPAASGHTPAGGKRAVTRLALQHLHANAPAPADTIALPQGAPFGGIEVDVAGCTLCLSCVGACPTGALRDNPDRPELRFQEDACIQCGLCRATCPERVMTLVPQLNFADDARQARIVKDEEPFHCIRCDKPFGTKASIERIVAQLAEKHPMFKDAAAADRLRMCENCRVVAQYETEEVPFAGADRPQVRTTDDYLREREEIEAARQQHRANGANGAGGPNGSGED
jgi:ferredoxin